MFRLRAIAVVIEGDQVLLVNCVGRPGHFVPPGGGVDPHESAQEAARREVEEETGVRAVIGDLIAYREVLWAEYSSFEVYFAGRPIGAGRDQAGSAELHVRWTPLSELARLEYFPERLPELYDLALKGGPPLYLGAKDLRRVSRG